MVTDVEERARHLARAAEGPDADIAAELEAAAENAAARGAPAAGAELCELAAELTAADPGLARERRMRAPSSTASPGTRSERPPCSNSSSLRPSPGVERADVLFEMAVTRRADSAGMIALCDQALAEATGDTERTVRFLAYRSFTHMFAADVGRALLDARAALEQAEQIDHPYLVAVAIARVGQAETYAAELTPGLLARGAEIEDRLGLSLEYYESPGVALARLQMRLGQVEEARAVLERLDAKAVARGDEGNRAQMLWSLSTVEWLAGRWGKALGYADEAYELMNQTQERRGMVGRVKALIEADLGLVEQARASVEEGLMAAQAMADEYFAIASIGVLGRLELALGNVEAAGGHLRDLPGRLVTLGINDPGAPVWPDAIETLIELRELEAARLHLDHYEGHARRLQSPWAEAAASRCRGLLSAAEGDITGAVAAFEAALTELDGLTYPLERGRTLLCLGATRRRAQQKGPARAALEQALAIFEELGARLWADKARAELRRISGRRPAAEALTETEHQVAGCAAQGLTNKEIASSLHMGVSTVEAHLSSVYRKLGVRRVELAQRLTSLHD